MTGDSRILQQLLGLWIILRFDLVVVKEVNLGALVGVNLKAIAIQRVLLNLTSDIVDLDWQLLDRSQICFRLANKGWMWSAAITGIFVIVQLSIDMVLSGASLHTADGLERSRVT